MRCLYSSRAAVAACLPTGEASKQGGEENFGMDFLIRKHKLHSHSYAAGARKSGLRGQSSAAPDLKVEMKLNIEKLHQVAPGASWGIKCKETDSKKLRQRQECF